jgi:hypothetical protein
LVDDGEYLRSEEKVVEGEEAESEKEEEWKDVSPVEQVVCKSPKCLSVKNLLVTCAPMGDNRGPQYWYRQ